MANAQRLARYSAWTCVALIIILSLLPGSERPHTGAPGKLEHFLAYTGTGVFAAFGYSLASQRFIFWMAIVILSSLLEFLQQYVPGRGPDAFDALASSSGLTSGLLIGMYFSAKVFGDER
jgi:VanZ family protein